MGGDQERAKKVTYRRERPDELDLRYKLPESLRKRRPTSVGEGMSRQFFDTPGRHCLTTCCDFPIRTSMAYIILLILQAKYAESLAVENFFDLGGILNVSSKC